VSAYIDEHRERFGVEPICQALGVSASAYYQRASGGRSERAVEDQRLVALIGEVHKANYECYGQERIWWELRRRGEDVGRDRVARLMRQEGVRGAKRRGKPWQTTNADPDAHKRPDLVQRDFTAGRPNELWVADLTHLRCWEGVLYLAFIIEMVVSYCASFGRVLVFASKLRGVHDQLAALSLDLWRERDAQPVEVAASCCELSVFDPVVDRPARDIEPRGDLLDGQLVVAEQPRVGDLPVVAQRADPARGERQAGPGPLPGGLEYGGELGVGAVRPEPADQLECLGRGAPLVDHELRALDRMLLAGARAPADADLDLVAVRLRGEGDVCDQRA